MDPHLHSSLPRFVAITGVFVLALGVLLLLSRNSSASPAAMALASPAALTPDTAQALPEPAAGTQSAAIGLIYTEIGQGQTTLWKANAANPNHRQNLATLTNAPAWDIQGLVSPQGDKVAYYRVPPEASDSSGRRSGGELWVMNVDGTHALRLAESVGGLVGWSPSGSSLAYIRASDGPGQFSGSPSIQLYTVPVAGGEARLLLTDDRHYVQPVGWSPDESCLYYAQAPQPGRYELWRVNTADGSTRVQTPLPSRSASMPYLLPDGKHLTMLIQEETGRKYVMLSIDGAEEKVLARAPNGDRVMDHIRPAWSRDGQEVVMRVPAVGGQPAQLQRLNPKLGRQIRIVPSLDRDNEILAPRSWSPDGEWLVVDDSPAGGTTTYLMRASGGPKTPLPDSAPRVNILGWTSR